MQNNEQATQKGHEIYEKVRAALSFYYVVLQLTPSELSTSFPTA